MVGGRVDEEEVLCCADDDVVGAAVEEVVKMVDVDDVTDVSVAPSGVESTVVL